MSTNQGLGGVSSLLADVKRCMDGEGLLPAQVFNSQAIHDLELRRIFARSWVFIGHESEIPRAGDYAIRHIGDDPFIFIRGKDQATRVLFTGCRHRGAQVCRSEKGNTSHFTCPYHGWTYDNTGKLIGVPARRDGYRELDLSQWNLLSPAHVSNYCGLIFANLDPNAMPLEDYLGKFRWYLDIDFNLIEGGMEVLGEPHRWIIDANWKQGAENFCADNTHTYTAHRSAIAGGSLTPEFVQAIQKPSGSGNGYQIYECDGHVMSVRLGDENETIFWQYPPELASLFKADRVSEAQFSLARRALNHSATIFPNLSFFHVAQTDAPGRPSAAYMSLRVWQPKAPGRTEVWNWFLAPKAASDAYKERAYQVGMASFGPSGSFEQDDVCVWPGIARTAGTVFAEIAKMKLNYQMGRNGMASFKPVSDWPGPGLVVPSNSNEGGLRDFHRTWHDRMSQQ